MTTLPGLFVADQDSIMIPKIPNLHDSLLWRIENLEPSDAKIHFRTTEGEIYEMTLLEVKRLKCDNFLQGNIVLGLYVIDSERKAEFLLKWILDEDPSDYSRRLVQEICEGSLCMIHITPSYGCEIACVCRSFDFRKV